MNKARLLIVEDDPDISNMLRIYFSGQNYEVDTAMRGSIALEKNTSGDASPDRAGYHAARY